MANVVPTTRTPLQLVGLIAGGVVMLNALFWVSSHFYFSGKPADVAATIGSARFAFATYTFIVAITAYGAAIAPRLIGHGLAFLMSAASIVGGIAAFAKGMHPTMGITMVSVGALVPVLAWKSLNRSRAAWAFLIAIVAVFGTVDFFGAPKIRGLLHIGLWHAMIISGLQIVCVVALTMLRGDYRERS